jgi:hypothetical protein
MTAVLFSGLVMLAQAAAPAKPPVILSCSLPSRAAAGAPVVMRERIFRVGPASLQELNPATGQFGKNLCASHPCAKTEGHSEGHISSGSVLYTIGIVNGSNQGYWRAKGASGLSANEGTCKVVAAPKAK